MTPLEQLKILTNETNDDKLNVMIDRTKKEIETITKKVYDSTTMDNVLVDMVLVKLNLKGNEGINSVSFNGIAEAYLPNYPKPILIQLDRLTKKVRLL